MTFSAIARISTETTFTLAVKNCFCFVALDNVRTSLQKTITDIVLPTLGRFIAPIVGSQIGTMCALPVTLLLGDLMVTALKEAVTSIHHLFCAVVYGEKNEPTTPFLRDLIISIASFAIGFFAKTYFCNYCMGPVSQALKLAIGIGAPLLGASLAVSLMAPAIIVLAAPAATFMVGDVLGSLASHASFNVLDYVSRWMLD